jgi:hypothetical protein
MTEWNSRAVRHIPEEELHAYLDQALSRSQCVEIESHMAECLGCSVLRDDTAALRDRTTSLLARLGPGLIAPPSYRGLRERFEADRRRRRQWTVRTGWAASLILATAVGWQVNRWLHVPAARETFTASAPAVIPATNVVSPSIEHAASPTPTPVARKNPSPPRQASASRAAGSAPLPLEARRNRGDQPDAMIASYAPSAGTPDQASQEVFSVETQPASGAIGLHGLWRSVGVDGLASASSGQLPRVPGLPVVQVQVQPGAPGADVTAVDQQLDDGQLIRTIEGPASRVQSLLAEQEAEIIPRVDQNSDTAPDRMTLTLRQGDRMLAVTGPSKVLGSLMMSRIGARRRY